MSESWKCRDCKGDGMYATDEGMHVCHCDAGRKRRAYLRMTPDERRAARREADRAKRLKKAKGKAREPEQEEIPF